MTEKQYGGSAQFGLKEKSIKLKTADIKKIVATEKSITEVIDEEFNPSSNLSKKEIEKLEKAGKIAKETIIFAKLFIKKGLSLLEIAEKIEAKIIELGGKPAFPVNLSINEIAAHSTPSFNDTSTAFGILKVDLGVHIDGYVADTAFSLDLENSEENKKLIEAAERALKKATDLISLGIEIRNIGGTIEKEIKSLSFQPISNLSGHSIEPYNLHAGVTIPNFDNSQTRTLEPGIYAIEPFVTNGLGSVRDGKPSGIYNLEKSGNVRDTFAREVLQFIEEEYQTLPFCSRWIYKKFSSRGLLALRRIEEASLLHQYPQLIESGKGKVAQAENTVIITLKEKIVTTV
jgi:methionyl aminopeptidase